MSPFCAQLPFRRSPFSFISESFPQIRQRTDFYLSKYERERIRTAKFFFYFVDVVYGSSFEREDLVALRMVTSRRFFLSRLQGEICCLVPPLFVLFFVLLDSDLIPPPMSPFPPRVWIGALSYKRSCLIQAPFLRRLPRFFFSPRTTCAATPEFLPIRSQPVGYQFWSFPMPNC